jgi:hypothetical protein
VREEDAKIKDLSFRGSGEDDCALEELAHDTVSEHPGQTLGFYQGLVRLRIARGHPRVGVSRFQMPEETVIEAAVRKALRSRQEKRLEKLADSVAMTGTGKTLLQLQSEFLGALSRDEKVSVGRHGWVQTCLLEALRRQAEASRKAETLAAEAKDTHSQGDPTQFRMQREAIEALLAQLRMAPVAEREALTNQVQHYLEALDLLASNEVQKHASQRLHLEFNACWSVGAAKLHGLAVHTVHWELLSSLGGYWGQVARHYESLPKQFRETCDLDRLHFLHDLKPDEIYVGNSSSLSR